MYQTLVSTENMTREEWLQWRMSGIGGSDASIVCGINKYKSPVQLYMEKTGQHQAEEAGESAYWGHVMEPIIREEFTKRSGIAVYELKAILRSEEYPFMLANLDGVTEDGTCIFKAKTASQYKAGEWEDGIPDAYMLQIQHYMSVTGMVGTYIAALIGGNTFKWQYIERDPHIIEMLIELESAFWHLVETNTPPEYDGSDASSELLSKLYSNCNKGSSIILPDNTITLIRQYEQAAVPAQFLL